LEAFISLALERRSMTTISIPLSEESLSRLRELAAQSGIPPEEFLRRRVERLLESPTSAFVEATSYVLTKNAELYRRLA
jgi:antitoxin FitA